MNHETKIHVQKLLDILSGQELSPEEQQVVAEATGHFNEQKQQFTVLTLHRDNLFDCDFLSRHLSDEQMEGIAANIRRQYYKTNFFSLMATEAGKAGIPKLFSEWPLLLTATGEIWKIIPEDQETFTEEEIQQLLVAQKPAIVAVSDFRDVAFIAVPDGRMKGLARNNAASEICRRRDIPLLCSTAIDTFGDMLICPKEYLTDKVWNALITAT